MANRDIAGLLTGISSTQRPNPNMNSDQWRMAFGAQQGQNLSNAVGTPSPEQAIQMGMGQLDLTSIKGLTTLAEMQQLRGDTVGAAKTASKIQAMRQAPLIAAKEEERYQEKLALDIRRTGATEQTAAAAVARAKAANEKSPLSQGSFKGESFKVRDENGNLFAAITTYNKDAEKVIVSYSNSVSYTHLTLPTICSV